MKKKYFFDACGTITKTNNTYAFVFYIIKNNPILKIKFFIFLIEGYFFEIIKQKNNTRLKIINLLKGYSNKELKRQAQNYVNKLEIKKLFNTEIVSKLIKNKKNSIIISSAINYPIEAIAKKFGIKKIISSELEIKNNKITGKLKTDLLYKKQNTANLFKDVDFKKSYFFSDNVEDIEFFKLFSNQIVIIDNEKKMNFWKKKFPKCKIILVKENQNKYPITINKKNYKLGYIPSLYYLLSRFNEGVILSLLIKEIIPITIINFYINSISLFKSLVLTILLYINFYSIYEIGNLFNDQLDKNKTTIRIPKNTKYNINKFIVIRIVFGIISFAFLIKMFGIQNSLYFYLFSIITLTVLLIHTLIKKTYRKYSFIILRLLKAAIPVYFLIGSRYLLFNIIAVFCFQHLNSIFYYLNKKFFDDFKNWIIFHLCTLIVCLLLSISTKNLVYVLIDIVIVSINFLKFFLLLNRNKNLI